MTLDTEDKKYIDSRIERSSRIFKKEMERYMGIVLEKSKHHVDLLIETMDARIDAAFKRNMRPIESRVDNHETRITSLELAD